MPPQTNFMESTAFEAKTSEVFVFLYCLMLRAVRCNLYPYIIVDCHGAHDTFTAGAVCAATDIVIVTTPDIGSLDGTKQLLQYSLRLRQTYARRQFRSKLVINRCFEGEPDVATLAKSWEDHVTDEPVRIERRDSIERLSRTYQFGAIARDRYLWERIEEIAQMPLSEKAPPAKSTSAVAEGAASVSAIKEVEVRALPAPAFADEK
jgi:cellulose biosynthesis protein BcsQ